jgi:hypothetical protein
MSPPFRNLSLAMCLFRIRSGIRHNVGQGKILLPQGSSRTSCTWDRRRRNLMRAELMTIVVSQVDNLRSSFELVNVCQGWEQSVLNRIFCVGNVAQTPQAGYIRITCASLRFGRSSR